MAMRDWRWIGVVRRVIFRLIRLWHWRASSFSRQPALTAKPCKKLHCSFFDRRARRPTQGLFKLFNRICQDLAKDRIVSFEDFRKSRVNGEALKSNRCIGLPTGKQL